MQHKEAFVICEVINLCVQSETRLQPKKDWWLGTGNQETIRTAESPAASVSNIMPKSRCLCMSKPDVFKSFLYEAISEGTIGANAYTFCIVYCVQQDENNSLRIQNDVRIEWKLSLDVLSFSIPECVMSWQNTTLQKANCQCWILMKSNAFGTNKLTVNFRSTILIHALFLISIGKSICAVRRIMWLSFNLIQDNSK